MYKSKGGDRAIRPAFTLLEVLVVIAVIGILAALLMPAIQAGREAGRRAACQNNMRQVAVAMTNFESVHRRFPPGYLGDVDYASPKYPKSTDHQMMGHLGYVLPYLEQSTLSEELSHLEWNVDRLERPWYLDRPALDLLQVSPVRAFLCPSDSDEDVRSIMVSLMPLSMTTLAGYLPATPHPFHGWTNYLGCSGRTPSAFLAGGGIFHARSKTTAAEIADGLSNTWLLGEVLGDFVENTDLRTARHCWLTGPIGVEFGWFEDSLIGDGQDTGRVQFRSRHPETCNFAFADGSVRSISATTSLDIIEALATMKGGETRHSVE